MSRPGDRIAADAAGHGRLGVSPAGREQVIEVLKTAFAQGRLSDHGSARGLTMRSRRRPTRKLTAVTADLPAGLWQPRHRARSPGRGLGCR